VTEAADHSDIQEIKKYNSKLFNEALWDLDFDISILINNKKELKVKDPNTSPFQTLSEIAEEISNAQHVKIKSDFALFFIRISQVFK